MNNTEQVVLINGTFSDCDAKEILYNIISTKIQFHSMKNFSSLERLGKLDNTSVKRINDLNNDLQKINTVLQVANKNKKQVLIHSSIYLSVTDKI